ncbi:MAG TPA: FAD-dependent oxidoreductase, partial [Acidocella sp.]|nr:FAD-dependent oxidoreductase [Acidocella sp.]
GGVPRHCGHPPFGLREFGRILAGPAYAKRLSAAAEAAGAKILTRHSVVRLNPGGVLDVATPDGMQELRALRVLLATGARETPRSARLIGGDRPLGVLNTGALQAHIYLQETTPFRRPVVVGTELVSLSALATCRRHGIRPVAMLEAGRRLVARRPFSLFPRLLRIPLHYGAEIEEICGNARVESVRLRDGREIECDGVLLTGKFVPESTLARMGHLAVDSGSNGPVVDQYGRCSDSAYFAAGNVLRGIETAGWSFREGTAIADYIADDLCGGLPGADNAVEIICGEGLKYAVPQSLARVSKLRGLMQLRVVEPARGQLRVRAGDNVLYRTWVSALPERRVLLDLEQIRLPQDVSQITVELVP